jgi:hypothetical protein
MRALTLQALHAVTDLCLITKQGLGRIVYVVVRYPREDKGKFTSSVAMVSGTP